MSSEPERGVGGAAARLAAGLPERGLCAHRGAMELWPENTLGGFTEALRLGAHMIELDVPKRTLNVLISDEELAKRKTQWKPPEPKYSRGYGKLYIDHVLQADEGCDFDFCKEK